MSFEFRFVAGYFVEIPIRELIGPANQILITVTVTPVSREGQEREEFQRFLETAEIPKGQKGRVQFNGSFALGEGRYDVRWELRDRFGRHCSQDWKVKTRLSKKDRDLELTLDPGQVAPSVVYLFRREEAVKSPAGKKLRVKLLVSMDVRRRRRVTVELWRYARLVSVLRVLSRHPSLVEFSVVAFSLEDQEVLFEQDYAGRIDFPRLGKTLKSLSPGTVNVKDLGKNKEKQFLASLIESELCCDETADAFIFVGSDVRLGEKVPKQAIAPLRELPVPVFYLNSEPHPWRGMLGNAVKVLKGEQYKIRKPRHLSAAVAEIVLKTDPSRPRRGS